MEKINGKDTKTVTKQEKIPGSDVTAEDSLVIEAYEYIKGIFVHHFQIAMLETGQYLIDKFYDGDYSLAQEKKFTKNKSLLQLFEKIQGDNSGNTPKKTWLYNSINLAIDENKYKELSAYGNLGHSHKVKLTNTGRLPEDIKLNLIVETAEKEYPVIVLQERIVQEKQKLNGTQVSLTEEFKLKKLKTLNFKKLESLKKQTETRFTKATTEMGLYGGNLKKINTALKAVLKDKQPKNKKITGFGEWIKKENRINICTGCPNDCKYCFAKTLAQQRNQLKGKPWSEQQIRDHDVNKKRKLHDGMVGFPTTHDISSTNIDAYIEVLNKLLDFGNEIMIVSKPNLECIKRICDEAADYKDKILFRFTIGAMDNNILSFWDNKAPQYQERKESLKYAFDNGFKTSISMEPLLDSANVVETATDLVQYVTDFIWIGTMNHIKQLRDKTEKDNDQPLIDAIKVIEDGQTDEKIRAIHDEFQTKPELFEKLKWKDSFKNVLGIKSAEAPGMDI